MSQSSTAAIVGTVLLPLLQAVGIEPVIAGSLLLLGSSMGGELFNPGAVEMVKLAELEGKVNWRTAVAYDGTKVIIEGLKRNTNRWELPKELHNRNRPVCGATGEISFTSSGERLQQQAFIIKPDYIFLS
ncbi:hypothetical protein [Scytonema sp. NUACC21]